MPVTDCWHKRRKRTSSRAAYRVGPRGTMTAATERRRRSDASDLLAALVPKLNGHRAVTATEIAQLVADAAHRPWEDARPLTARRLARLLRPLGCGPRSVRLDSKKTVRGYRAADLRRAHAGELRAWRRSWARPAPGAACSCDAPQGAFDQDGDLVCLACARTLLRRRRSLSTRDTLVWTRPDGRRIEIDREAYAVYLAEKGRRWDGRRRQTAPQDNARPPGEAK